MLEVAVQPFVGDAAQAGESVGSGDGGVVGSLLQKVRGLGGVAVRQGWRLVGPPLSDQCPAEVHAHEHGAQQDRKSVV